MSLLTTLLTQTPTSGGGGSGDVDSVTNADGTLTINPITGSVVAKLAALPSAYILVGNGSSVATGVAVTGDVSLTNTGLFTLATVNSNVGSFTNANITVNAKGLITAAASSGDVGTVTSVGLSLPNIFSISGSPVTTAGTLAGTFVNQSAKMFFAGPLTGGPATPAFRAFALTDLPAAVQGEILYFNGTQWVVLGPGISGQFLQTNGVAANPTWDTVTGAGNVIGPGTSLTHGLTSYADTTGELIESISLITVGANNTLTGDGSGAFTLDGGGASVVANGVIFGSGGDVFSPGVVIQLSSSNVGAANIISCINTDNTSGSSNACLKAQVGGASGGDPFTLYNVAASNVVTGIDNSDSDAYVVAMSATLGTSNALRIASDLSMTIYGNLTLNGSINAGLTNGQLLIGSTGLSAVKTTITQGPGIIVTNGAGSITIAADGSAGGRYTHAYTTGNFTAGVLQIPQATHGLPASQYYVWSIYDTDTGLQAVFDYNVDTSGNITFTNPAGVGINCKIIILD